jgi:hypothetical protein
MEHKWECEVAKDRSQGDFEAALICVADNVIIAYVKRSFEGRTLDKAAFDEHRTIVLKLKGCYEDENEEENYDRDIEVSGQLTSNHLLNCELVILLKKVGKTFRRRSTRIGERKKFLAVYLKIEVIDKLAKENVRAVNECYDRFHPVYKRFWPALLAESPEPLKAENFVAGTMGMEQATFDDTVQAVIVKMTKNGTPPNPEQGEILRSCHVSFARLRVMWGSPGTGKTFLATKLAEIFLGCPNTGVAIFAPSNGSTDRIFDAVQAWLKGKVPGPPYEALRVHWRAVELEHFWKVIDPSGQGDKKKRQKDAGVHSTPMGQYNTRQKEAAQKNSCGIRMLESPLHSSPLPGLANFLHRQNAPLFRNLTSEEPKSNYQSSKNS